MTLAPVYIHIGYPKTGTTWLQVRAFPANPNIEFVPTSRDSLFESVVTGGPASADKEKLTAIRENATKPVLVSYESLAGEFIAGPNVEQRAIRPDEIAQALKEVAPDARILITIREQRDMIESMYRHYIFGGFSKSPVAAMDSDLIAGDYLCYDIAIKRYENLFGRENVWVGLYEALNADAAGFLDDLYRFIGVDSVLPARSELAKRDNVGISSGLLKAIMLYNRSLGKLVRPHLRLHAMALRNFKRIDKVFGGGASAAHLTDGAFDPGPYAESNLEIDRARGLGLGRYGYVLP